MKRLALLAAAMAALVVPASASAHAALESASPGAQSKVAEPPTEVVLRFSEPLTITSRAVLVLAPNGTCSSGEPRLSEDRRVVTTPVSGLAKGEAYTVRWRVTGVDGHSPAGVFTFGVGVRAPPPTDAVGASGAVLEGRRSALAPLRRDLARARPARRTAPRAARAPCPTASSGGSISSRPSLRSLSSTSESPRSSFARRTRCSFRSSTCSTATCRPSPRRRDSASPSS